MNPSERPVSDLESERARAAATLDSLLDPHIMLKVIRDQTGRIVDFEYTDANDAACKYNKTSREELIGARLLDLLPGHVGSGLFDMYAKTVETGEVLILNDYKYPNEIMDSDRRYDIRGVKVGDSLSFTWRDVTDEREVFEDYQLLAENASDIVYRSSPDGTIEWVSPSVTELLGWKFKELIGHSISEIMHPDDLAQRPEWIKAAVDGGTARSEGRLVSSEGRYRWYSFAFRSIRDEQGTVVSLIESARNIDDEIAVRDALEESEERYRTLAEAASDVVCQIGDQCRIDWVSPSIETVLGWHPKAIVGEIFTKLNREEDLEEIAALRIRVIDGETLSAVEFQFRTSSGEWRWMSAHVRPIMGEDGKVRGAVVGLRDCQKEVLGRQATERSEARFRLLAEHASDVVYLTDLDGVITWISPSVERVLGWGIGELLNSQALDLVCRDDIESGQQLMSRLHGGESIESAQLRFRSKDGEFRWFGVLAQPILGDEELPVSMVVTLRDTQSEVLVRRALTTLSVGGGVLVRAEHEDALLSQMCQTAVDEGGYMFSWYGRPIEDVEHTVMQVATSQEFKDYVDEIEISWGEDPLALGPTERAIRNGEMVIEEDFALDTTVAVWRTRALAWGFRSAIALPVFVDGIIDGAFMVYAAEPFAFDQGSATLLKDLASQLGYGLGRLRGQQRLIKSLDDQTLLTTAIDQAVESVIVTDSSASILFANPAALRTSGYSLDEVLGQNPSMFSSGINDQSFYEDLWSQLLAGNSWHGVLTNRRKSGELFDEDVTISPIYAADGSLMAYAAVKYDLTNERLLEAVLDRDQRDRDDIIHLMRVVHPCETLDATAKAFCQAVTSLESVEAAVVLLAQEDGYFLPVGLTGDSGLGLIDGSPIRSEYTDMFVTQTTAGPWWLDLSKPGGFVLGGFLEQLRSLEYVAIAWTPIRREGELTGILALGIKDPEYEKWGEGRLPAFEELGNFAGTLFGAQVDLYGRRESLRAELTDIIDNQRFHPVFQPVLDLASRQIVGYEALTRFDDGRRPDLRFVEASTVGLGSALETTCAAAALEAATDLPADAWVSLNFSPESVIKGHVAELAAKSVRSFSIEITEHARIDDYEVLRKAINEIEDAKFLVDDAGAGYAGLCHILELHPNVVKLDIALVRNIDSDPARQALVSGMRHFAKRTGIALLAEGVETQGEADTLLELGVEMAQGFLFGRPERLPKKNGG